MDSILTVTVDAADNDLIDLLDVKEELGITDTTSDSKLQRWISEESQRISDYCGRTFPQQTVSETFRLDTPPSRSYDRRIDTLVLTRRPVISITSITEDSDDPLTASDYEVNKDTGILYRLTASGSSDTRTLWTAYKVVVVYIAGYAVGTIPSAISAACMTLLKHRWSAQSRDPALRSIQIQGVGQKSWWVGGIGEVGDLPPEVAASLDRYREVSV